MFDSKSCPAYILAGGRSERFGSDKARVLIDGQPNLLRLIEQLRRDHRCVHVIADRVDRYSDIAVTALADHVRERGPIAGLEVALEHRLREFGRGWVLLIACDQVIWNPAWFTDLSAHVHDHLRAIVFAAEVLQPIPGLFHTDLLMAVRQAVDENRLSLRRLLDSPQCRPVQSQDSKHNPRESAFNTQAELQAILNERLHATDQ